MIPSSALLVLLPILPLTLAQVQNFIPSVPSSAFPACGLSCTVLQQAQGSCIPPAAPVTSQTIYNSCFCQSGLLAPWYTTPNGVCDPFCPNPADLVTLQNWYRGFCAQQTAAGNQPTTSTTSVSTSSLTTSASTSTSTSNRGSGSSSENSNNSQPQGWFATHWRWILMLVLLLILLPALAFLAMYLKRRNARKREATQLAHNGGMPPPSDSEYHHHNFFGGRWRSRSNSHGKNAGSRTRDFGADGALGRTATPGTMSNVAGRQEMWGPHQGMAHTRGWGDYSYSSEDLQAISSRGGAGDKVAEATIAARAATSAGHGNENERPGTASRKERRKRYSRSERNMGKGKERGVGEEVWEDETEGPMTGSPGKRRKRRSKSQRDRREREVDRDTESRFSM